MTLFDVDLEDGLEWGAVISPCETYRFQLTRIWDADLPVLVVCMLNPSKADALKNDPTILRCIDFAKRWGYGGIIVVNLFACRATDPAAIATFPDPVGPLNDQWIFDTCRGRDVLCAWGASVPTYWRHRPAAIVTELRQRDARLYHLGLTKDGNPRHPLYIRADTAPTRWEAA